MEMDRPSDLDPCKIETHQVLHTLEQFARSNQSACKLHYSPDHTFDTDLDTEPDRKSTSCSSVARAHREQRCICLRKDIFDLQD